MRLAWMITASVQTYRTSARPRKRLERFQGVLRLPDFQRANLEAEQGGRVLELSHLEDSKVIADVSHERQTAQMRDHFAQKLQPLAGEIISDCGKTGRMTSGPRQTGNQAGADGIAGRCKDDGNRLRRL